MFAVHLTQASPHHIAVLVTDQGGPNHPQIGHPGPDQESRRGLKVVAALASQLITTGDTNGRSVLAVIPDPEDDTASRLKEPRMTDDTAISRTSIKHAYQQVADAITARITSGQYTIKLPSERALAEEFGVSYITVQHATKILRQRALIVSIHGRGTYVAAALARN